MNLGIRSPMRHSPLQFFSQSGVLFNTSSGDKSVALTPAIGDLALIFCATTGGATDPAPFDDNADGLGGAAHYAKLKGTKKLTNADALTVWARDGGIGSATSTTFSGGLPTNNGGGIIVVLVRGARHYGATAVRSVTGTPQVGGENNQAASSTPAPSYPAAVPLATNMQIGSVLNGDNPATLAPPAGWTERHDVGYTVPTTGLQVVTADYGFIDNVVTWGSTSGSAYCSLIIELDGAP